MKYILILVLSAFSFVGYSQNALDVISSHGIGVNTEQVSFANPYIGATLLYNVDENRPLNESVLFTASVLQILASGDRFSVPVVGRVGLGDADILTPGSGLNLGIFPYYKLTTNQSPFQIYAHGGLNYKVITSGVGTGDKAPQQIRALAGIEAVFTQPQSKGPTTLSITPVFMFNTNSVETSSNGLEVSFVLPIGSGLGLFAEGLVPFNASDFNSGLRFGVVATGKL